MPKYSRRRIIERVEHRRDGWWIILKRGFQNGLERGSHTIHDDLRKYVHEDLAHVIPCDCPQCR